MFERAIFWMFLGSIVALALSGCQGDVEHKGEVKVLHTFEVCDGDAECEAAIVRAFEEGFTKCKK